MNYINKTAKILLSNSLNRFSAWNDDRKIKVLVKTWDGFDNALWSNITGEKIAKLEKYAQFIFTFNKLDFIKNIKNADIVFSDSIETSVNNKKIKFIQVPLSGVDYIEKYKSLKGKIVTSRGLSSDLISEYVLTFILLQSKRINIIEDNMKNQKWEQSALLKEMKKNSDVKICVYGFGSVGKKIVENLSQLGFIIYIIDENYNNKIKNDTKIHFIKNLSEINGNIDFIVLAVPLTKKTKKMVDSKFIENIGENCCLINISRGEIINEKDLIYALKNNLLKSAVLDVVSNEPLLPSSELWNCPNLIITPHVAGNINLIKEQILERFINNVWAVIKGSSLIDGSI